MRIRSGLFFLFAPVRQDAIGDLHRGPLTYYSEECIMKWLRMIWMVVVLPILIGCGGEPVQVEGPTGSSEEMTPEQIEYERSLSN